MCLSGPEEEREESTVRLPRSRELVVDEPDEAVRRLGAEEFPAVDEEGLGAWPAREE